MNIRDFILALFLVKHLSYRGRAKIWQYLSEHPTVALPLPIDLLKKITGSEHLGSYPSINELMELKRLTYITIIDECYPPMLKEIVHPPLVLFYCGNLQLLAMKKVGIVGARMHSQYATKIIKGWGEGLTKQAYTIVSGLAQGIDSLAHDTMLNNGGSTIAVVGTGLNVVYPARHRTLQQKIGQHGLLLSEYLPEMGPRRYHFPERNRIIAGLCSAIVVVEARKRSGSLITARLALEANRSIFALPGRIDDLNSFGTNQLINDGAIPILSNEDLFEKLSEHQFYI